MEAGTSCLPRGLCATGAACVPQQRKGVPTKSLSPDAAQGHMGIHKAALLLTWGMPETHWWLGTLWGWSGCCAAGLQGQPRDTAMRTTWLPAAGQKVDSQQETGFGVGCAPAWGSTDGDMPDTFKGRGGCLGATFSDPGRPGDTSPHASRRCWAVYMGIWATACRSSCSHPTKPDHPQWRQTEQQSERKAHQHMLTAGAPCMGAWCTF